MKVMLAQLNPIIGDVDYNTRQMVQAIEAAKTQGANLVIFPEMAISGYPARDLLLDPEFIQACLAQDTQIAQHSTTALCLIWGNLSLNTTGAGKPLYNTAVVAFNGVVQAYAIKNHLPTYDVFDEARYFEPGPVSQAVYRFTWQGQPLALTVCEDIWSHPALEGEETRQIAPYNYPTQLFEQTGQTQQPDFWLNISASPYVSGKPALRQNRLSHLAQKTGSGVMYVNAVGAQDDIIFDGHSQVHLPNGVMFEAPGFKAACPIIDTATTETWPAPIAPLVLEAERYEALVLGIRDYFGKTGFQKAFLGLSGGVDSALVAVLAAEALGADNVIAIAMPGPYSSDHSLSDARTLAQNLGVSLRELSILEPYQSFLDLLSRGQAQGDLAEQNLQARLRGLTLMTLANRENGLVLATSNKSELAMGYSTLYGDSCGALAPIGDLFKTEVYSLCRWINRAQSLIPNAILTKAPSAELSPNQKDSDTLPPYDQLDSSLKTLFNRTLHFGNSTTFMYDISHEHPCVCQPLYRAEFKRQQSPPILKVSTRGFDSGWRTQIVKRPPITDKNTPKT